MRHALSSLGLLGLLMLVPPVMAQAAPHCEPGEPVAFVLGFAALQARLGDSMGQPLECEHANAENGDALQQTSTGLAFYRKSTNTPTFTTGFEHWALTAFGMVYWTGESIDPPEAGLLHAPTQQPSAPAAAPSGPPPTVTRVVEMTNVERQKAGLQPLALNPSLLQAAESYAGVMAASSCFGHECGPVRSFSDRAAAAGYTGWIALAENVAAGYPSPEQVMSGWMNSSGHRANILNPRLTEIGVGQAAGGSMGFYWVQVFGARR
jgi:uncharacterized protein YkwD